MPDITITFDTNGEDIRVLAARCVDGDSLLELARKAGIAIDAPCGGNGSCGKCRVRLTKGELLSSDERSLSAEDKAAGWHLACKSKVQGDASVQLPSTAKAWRSGLRVAEDNPQDDAAWQSLLAMLQDAGVISCAASAPEHGTAPATPATPPAPYALACDIGTTGVSMTLLNTTQNAILAQASMGNAQIQYGADVINRIIAQARPGGSKRLRDAIINDTVNPLITAICTKANIAPGAIAHIVFAGNPTMNHLLLGISAESIRMEPFEPSFLAIDALTASELGLPLPPTAPVYIAPNVGGYVGGDITAGILASGLWQSQELELFVDLGTNGELVFGNQEFMMTCACSAGPAFEGGDIECGMRATEGAIEAASIDAQTLEPQLAIIGAGKPAGICGSGLIDLVSELFSCGALNGKGRIIAEGKRFWRDPYGVGSYVVAFAQDTADGRAITLSEVDIDNFIRAKAAIFSAITVMLDMTGFAITDITRVLVAGGIGSGIDIPKAVSIGLFPNIARESFAYLGNTSLQGARAMTLSAAVRAKVNELAANMTYLELSSEPTYMDAFIAASFIPHTNATLFA
jgi:uncharacterized 2Fe-2S/4Fe-4S cluster protein (DUF4445 family)